MAVDVLDALRTLTLPPAPHPTPGEWAARQAALPEPAKATLAALATQRAARLAEHERLADEERARAQNRRPAFEEAVAAELKRVGAEWLAAYRLSDFRAAAGVFDSQARYFSATWDAGSVGCWPIRLELVLVRPGGPEAERWRPDLPGWMVDRPSGTLGFDSFPAALEAATDYSPPF